MSNYSIKIDCSKLKGAFIRQFNGKTGEKRCVCIPIEEVNGMYEGEKGVYLNITATAMKEPRFADTHYIKPNIDKDVYQSLSEDERKSIPIIGGMHEMMQKNKSAIREANNDDDLPF